MTQLYRKVKKAKSFTFLFQNQHGQSHLHVSLRHQLQRWALIQIKSNINVDGDNDAQDDVNADDDNDDGDRNSGVDRKGVQIHGRLISRFKKFIPKLFRYFVTKPS